MNRNYFYFLVGLGLIIVDQVSKVIASRSTIIFRNYNFAFSLSLPVSVMYLFYAVVLVAIVIYMWYRHRSFSSREWVAWVLILAGSASNIGERLIAGYVKDFIYLFSGVFNIADFYILIGIVMLLLVSGPREHGPDLR